MDTEQPTGQTTEQQLAEAGVDDAQAYAESYGLGMQSRTQDAGEEASPQAQGSWVCVVPDESSETAGPAGLILLPDSARRKAGRLDGYRTGRVAHIGPGRHHTWVGTPGNDPTDVWHQLDDIVRVGDKVMFSRYHSDAVRANIKLPRERKHKRREVVFVQVSDLWAKVED